MAKSEEKKKKILVVEDAQDLSILISRKLTNAGYEVKCVGDAYQAVHDAHQYAPDLLILDLMLPAGGGLSVIQRLKKLPDTSNIPILVMTGVEDGEHKKQVLEAGVHAYLEKPYDAEKLIETIKELLC